MLGKFDVTVGNRHLETLPGRRTKDLLAYILLYRNRPHHREALAGTLWPESETAQSRKYLRQSLWHLRVLDSEAGESTRHPLVKAGPEWLEIDSTRLRLDVANLEAAFEGVKLVAGEDLGGPDAEDLCNALPLYRGDLLEGCYDDWCIYERERLRAMYLSMLEKLLAYCEANARHDEGLDFGEKLLRQDRAHERAHCRMMRLRYLAGDRSGALRQFESCREALREELGVAPAEATVALYNRMKAGQFSDVIRGPERIASDAVNRASATLSALPGKSMPVADSGVAVHLQTALEALSLAERLVELSLKAVQDRP